MNDYAQPSWFATLYRCLEQGRADEALYIYLDDFLAWRLGLDLSNPCAALAPLVAQFGEQGFKKRFEEFIDQLLIANPNNYKKLFPSELSSAQAKSRYRQLIRVFHPDRGAKDELWLTFRAERVNAAYHAFNNQERPLAQTKQSQHETPLTPKTVKPKARHAKRRVIPPIAKRDVRRWLGSPETFQKKITVWLIGSALFLVALLLLSALAA